MCKGPAFWYSIRIRTSFNAALNCALIFTKSWHCTCTCLLAYLLTCWVLTHKVLMTSTPPYLHDMQTIATPARPMRSAGAPLLFVPLVRTEFARHTFSVAGSTVYMYNSLPADIILCHSVDSFKRHLKTHLFKMP